MSKYSPNEPMQSTDLQVIDAGLPRTSTSSLQTALQTLGFTPCYHTITDLLPRARKHGDFWLQAMYTQDKPVRHKILAERVHSYSAIVDGPGCFFVEDWIEMNPDAKVVLGLRTSPQAWLDSVNTSIGKVFGTGLIYYLTYFVPEMHYGFLINNLWDQCAQEKYGVGMRTTQYCSFHSQHIREIVPKERQLEFKAAGGRSRYIRFWGRSSLVESFHIETTARRRIS